MARCKTWLTPQPMLPRSADPAINTGQGHFPNCAWLCESECGSHAIVDATITDRTQSERRQSFQLLRSLKPEMFLLHDAQFTGFAFWRAVRERRAHAMGPLPSHHLPTYLRQRERWELSGGLRAQQAAAAARHQALIGAGDGISHHRCSPG